MTIFFYGERKKTHIKTRHLLHSVCKEPTVPECHWPRGHGTCFICFFPAPAGQTYPGDLKCRLPQQWPLWRVLWGWLRGHDQAALRVVGLSLDDGRLRPSVEPPRGLEQLQQLWGQRTTSDHVIADSDQRFLPAEIFFSPKISTVGRMEFNLNYMTL